MKFFYFKNKSNKFKKQQLEEVNCEKQYKNWCLCIDDLNRFKIYKSGIIINCDLFKNTYLECIKNIDKKYKE